MFCVWLAMIAAFAVVPSTRAILVKPYYSTSDLCGFLLVWHITSKFFGPWSEASAVSIVAEVLFVVGVVAMMVVATVYQCRWWRVDRRDGQS